MSDYLIGYMNGEPRESAREQQCRTCYESGQWRQYQPSKGRVWCPLTESKFGTFPIKVKDCPGWEDVCTILDENEENVEDEEQEDLLESTNNAGME